jgi:hypothetical protein
MFKNAAGQKISLFAYDVTTGLPKTGDAANLTAYVSKDFGAVTALTDTTATEKSAANAPGWYDFDVAQAESNADHALFSGKSTTANVIVVGMPIYTLPNRFTSLGIDVAGAVLIQTNLKRGQAISERHVTMVDPLTGVPQTGKTVAVTRVKGSTPAVAATPSTAPEIGDGLYYFGGSSTDTDAPAVTFIFTAPGCRTVHLSYTFEP